MQLHACTHEGGPLREHSEVVARLQLLVHVPLHEKHQAYLHLRPICVLPTNMYQDDITLPVIVIHIY